jgi:hypothetical protein
LHVVQLVQQGVELAKASLALDHLLQAVDLALHQLGILVSLG